MPDGDPPDPLTWARAEVRRLGKIVNEEKFAPSTYAIMAVEFLHQQAPRSTFARRAQTVLDGKTTYATAQIAHILQQWITYAESGLTKVVPYETRFRVDAATDLMEQVETLLADKRVHPAVPIMVAGAALEEFLRSLHATTTEKIAGDPSIAKYGNALRTAEVIDKTANHMLTSMAATRNEAAHGHFEKLTNEVARLFVQQVNLFIAQHSPPT